MATYVEAFKELGNLEDYSAIFSYGIVNPAGPTLTVLAAKTVGTKDTTPVVLLQLHPFVPEILKTWIIPTDKLNSLEGIKVIMDDLCFGEMAYGSCPTVFLVGPVLPYEDALNALTEIVLHRDGGKNVLNNVLAFPGKPFERVAFEMDMTFRPYNHEHMELKEAYGFVIFQMKLENLKPEFQSFLEAYSGAIEFIPMLPAVLNPKDFFTVFNSIVFK